MIGKYQVIDDFFRRGEGYAILAMCGWLAVSRSGFYEWRSRPVSATAQRRAWLAALITEAFDRSRGTSGYRRVHAQLARWGEPAGPELVRDLMRELGLLACQPRPFRVTTDPDPAAAGTPDQVGRDFTADRPGQRLVGDITYIRTWEGWLYLATVIDCFDRRVVGWSMAEHMRAEPVGDAITMAAGNVALVDAVFHSDRGSIQPFATPNA